MALFLLEPCKLEAPEWQLSSHHQAVQVEADDEEQARFRAARQFREITKGQAGMARPWMIVDLVKVSAIEHPSDELEVIYSPANSSLKSAHRLPAMAE